VIGAAQVDSKPMDPRCQIIRQGKVIVVIPRCKVLSAVIICIQIHMVVALVHLAMSTVVTLHGIVTVRTRVVQLEVIQDEFKGNQVTGREALPIGRRLQMEGGRIAIIIAFFGLGHQDGQQAHLVAGTITPLHVLGGLLHAIDELLVCLAIIKGTFQFDTIAGLNQHFIVKIVYALPVEIPVANIQDHLFSTVSTDQGSPTTFTQVVHMNKTLVQHPGVTWCDPGLIAQIAGKQGRRQINFKIYIVVTCGDRHSTRCQPTRVGDKKTRCGTLNFVCCRDQDITAVRCRVCDKCVVVHLDDDYRTGLYPDAGSLRHRLPAHSRDPGSDLAGKWCPVYAAKAKAIPARSAIFATCSVVGLSVFGFSDGDDDVMNFLQLIREHIDPGDIGEFIQWPLDGKAPVVVGAQGGCICLG